MNISKVSVHQCVKKSAACTVMNNSRLLSCLRLNPDEAELTESKIHVALLLFPSILSFFFGKDQWRSGMALTFSIEGREFETRCWYFLG
jgi:hypothetical protein